MLGKCPDSDIPVKVPKCEEKADIKPELGGEIANSIQSIVQNMDQKHMKKLSIQIDFQFGEK